MKTGNRGDTPPVILVRHYMVKMHSFTLLYPLGKINRCSVKTSLSAAKIGLGALEN